MSAGTAEPTRTMGSFQNGRGDGGGAPLTGAGPLASGTKQGIRTARPHAEHRPFRPAAESGACKIRPHGHVTSIGMAPSVRKVEGAIMSRNGRRVKGVGRHG